MGIFWNKNLFWNIFRLFCSWEQNSRNGNPSIPERKKRKNRLYLENWRPISLLNIDYKIAAKVMAGRLSKVLPKLINEDQTGYIQGRYIGQNIRLIQDIMKVTSLESIPGLAIFIDFKKAFDSLDWNFLNKTLQSFNFGPNIQKWVKTFYTDISSCVINNCSRY